MNDERPNVNYGDRKIAMKNEILRTVVGSGVHGIAIEGTDDHDEMGIYIEPAELVIGTSYWSYSDNCIHDGGTDGQSGMPHYVFRTKPEGERSGPGDTDLNMYSLRKFVALAAKGNPTALLPLFAPESSVLVYTGIGMNLRDLRESFLSQSAVHRFLAYMYAQHERMLGMGKQGRVPSRPELIEKYGWDVKYGSHALRLAYQGLEVASEGRLTLPLPSGARDRVLAVKQGYVSREMVSKQIEGIAREIENLLHCGETPLPEEPDWRKINFFVQQSHLQHWGIDLDWAALS